MLNKKFIILAIFFISMIAVSAVSAAENATDEIAAADAGEKIILEETNEDELNVADENDVISANPKTFKELNSTINGNASSSIDLYDDFAYVENNDSSFTGGVPIFKENCVIDGHGHTIDGKSQSRIFWNTAEDVTFKNIKFINSKGSVVTVEGVDLWANMSFVNCTFINNSVYDSGLIYNQGNLFVENCTFADNYADNGAALQSSIVHVTNSNFNNNIMHRGVVIHCNKCIVSYSIFNNNSAVRIISLSDDRDTKINNNIFVNNRVDYDIYCDDDDWRPNANYNWFGNNATNYFVKLVKVSGGVGSDSWLFLNATVIPDTVSILGTTDVVFKLFAFNQTSQKFPDYDNTLLRQLNLTVSTTNGHVNENITKLGDAITFTPDDIGTGSVTASIGEVRYTIEFNIVGEDPELSVESEQVYYSNNTMIALNYNETATGKVNISLKGKKFNYTFKDKELSTAISLGLVNPDEYNVTVSYSGDATFASCNATGNLTVMPIVDVSVIIASDKEVYFIGDEVIWYVTVHNAANGTNATKVYMTIDLPSEAIEIVSWTTHNGTCSQHIGFEYIWNIGFMGNGTTAELIIYSHAKKAKNETYLFANGFADEEDWNMSNNIAQKYVDVIKYSSSVNVSDTVLDYGHTASVTATTEGATGITAKIDGKNTTVKGNVIMIPVLDAGTHTLTVTTVPDENHTEASRTAKITVNKLETQLTANAITATYNVNKDLVITLKDANGKALGNVKVTVNLNGAKEYKTDNDGKIKVKTKGLAPKTYTAKITFDGNANYIKSAKDVKVTVKKAAPKLSAKKKTFKSEVKTKKYPVTLKDNVGKAIKKAKLTLKVKGKKYKAKTNGKGKATFKITKLNKKGTYKAVIKYKGNKYYKKTSKNSKVKVKVTFKTVSKGSKDKSTVKKIQQALKDNGYYLSYKGHYLKVDGKYNSCTVRSVKEFQRDRGLKATGKVDYKTAEKLKII